jgi:hypothetical protein
MRISTIAAFAACLSASAACHSTTVRGTEGRSLTATTPVSMSIRRGTSAPLEVAIDRQRFAGPVRVTLTQLPDGVAPDRTSIDAETTTATFILNASQTADLVGNQAVGVTVEDPTGRRATQYVAFSVTD